MHFYFVLTVALLGLVCAGSFRGDSRHDVSEEIIALERAALDRWGKGDPSGYLEIYASEITYFDPAIERRLDGLDTMRKYYAPIEGKIKLDRYEMINPKVQVHGDTALLTFNLVDYAKQPDGSEKVSSLWNSTEVYVRINGEWKIIHSHWSYIKPELKEAGAS